MTAKLGKQGFGNGGQQHLVRFVLVALMALVAQPVGSARAADSDLALFTNGASSAKPNILILLDTSGSMGKAPSGAPCANQKGVPCKDKRELASEAIIALVNQTNPPDGAGGRVEKARFGFGIFTKDGGRVMVPIGSGTTDAIISYNQDPDNLKSLGGNSHGMAMVDMMRYLAFPYALGPLPAWPDPVLESPTGNQPVPAGVSTIWDADCRQTYLVHVDDGLWGGKDGDRFGEDCGDLNGDGEEDTCYLEYIDDIAPMICPSDVWMNDISKRASLEDFSPDLPGLQSVVTNVVGFDVDFPCLEDTATQGNGSYHSADTGAAFSEALFDVTAFIFDDVQVGFSAVAIPTSQTAFSNGLFTSHFVTDSKDPFWEGHLQSFVLSPSAGVLGKSGGVALNPFTGEFTEPRNPFWDLADRLKNPLHPTRNIFSRKAGANLSWLPAAIDAADLDVQVTDLLEYSNDPAVPFADEETLTDAIVDYLRGADAFDKDRDGNTTEIRDKVLGDIFHSSPVVIGPPPLGLSSEEGYGPVFKAGTFMDLHQDRKRRIYVGANDGMLHGVNAGEVKTGDNPATPEIESGYYDLGSGNEEFAFIPPALLKTLKFIPRNQPRNHFYVDGNPVAADAWFATSDTDLVKDPDEWTTVLVSGLRRGGNAYFALDVTDPDATGGTHGPYPKFLWELDDTTEPLGETWSQPIVTRIRVEGPGSLGDNCGADNTDDGDCREQWVAIVGGGFLERGQPNSASYLADPNNPTWSNASKSVLIIAIDTGKVLAKLEYDAADAQLNQMVYAIPSTPAVLDLDFDGFADLVYIGDVGGQLWKWDIGEVGTDGPDADTLIDNWSYGVFFRSEKTPVGGGIDHYRQIFFPPSAALVEGELVLAFGTGERTDPNYAGAGGADDNNRLYVVKDLEPHGANSIPPTAWTESVLVDITSLSGVPPTPNQGFFIVAEEGEKFITSHVIFAGVLISTSYAPSTGTDVCSGLGTAFLHVFDLETGEGFFDPGPDVSSLNRRLAFGKGVPSDPKVSVSGGSSTIFVQTAGGQLFGLGGVGGDDTGVQIVYWKQDL